MCIIQIGGQAKFSEAKPLALELIMDIHETYLFKGRVI